MARSKFTCQVNWIAKTYTFISFLFCHFVYYLEADKVSRIIIGDGPSGIHILKSKAFNIKWNGWKPSKRESCEAQRHHRIEEEWVFEIWLLSMLILVYGTRAHTSPLYFFGKHISLLIVGLTIIQADWWLWRYRWNRHACCRARADSIVHNFCLFFFCFAQIHRPINKEFIQHDHSVGLHNRCCPTH